MRVNKVLKPITLLAAAALSVVGVVPASIADTFTPQNDPPTVTINTVPTSMQPANPRSTVNYEVNVTIGSQGTAENLDTVSICFHEYITGDSSCSNAATDPTHEFKMTWTQSSNSYAVTGTNNYIDAGSSSDYGDGTGLTLTINFKFKISNAMARGEFWAVSVLATDDQGQDNTEHPDYMLGEDIQSDIEVLYFGAVTTTRTSQSYGNLAYMGSATAEAINSGSLLANGSSDLSIEATDFTNGSSTVSLSTFSGFPNAGEAVLECNTGSNFGSGMPVTVSGTPTTLDYSLFSMTDGTGETADTSHQHSCELTFGGGATTANVQHTNTVTISIGPGI